MPKLSEGKFAIGFLAILAIWTLIALPILYSQDTGHPVLALWRWLTHDAITVFNLLLVVVTGGLVWMAHRQFGLTKQIADRQTRDTEIVQRAYIAAELGGIRDMTGGQLVGHVIFHNVGHLPATNLRDVVKKIEVQDAAWRPPTIPNSELEDHGVLPIGVRMKKGSAGTIYPGAVAASSIREKYLYVWGRMTYIDGFERPKYVNFCHRYPYDKRETPSGGGFLISEEHGRYHEHGNDAD